MRLGAPRYLAEVVGFWHVVVAAAAVVVTG